MRKITSGAELKNAIQLLEVEKATKKQLLKNQFHITYESFKPVNLIRNTLKDIAKSPVLVDTIIAAALSLTTGYLTKKIIVRNSGNIFRKLIGSVLQIGISNIVAKHPEAIKAIGQFLFQHILRKKKSSEKP
jgi:hypothetical protein